ncbi:hypothetical protein [Acaryochloris sp. CCMEE 5410]|uniref:hypothetical protein n=1 Tax=Acaryochloris sp. CCMEE 5410 TaxID=310037 RepID=UPI0002483DA2|nr:hypothetical protein [Acaryochloris sp. CCMEE 5410]KAI9134736.1 hypothetical protein ON05_016690 [Acaryochloris sp. CCMEE 5410]
MTRIHQVAFSVVTSFTVLSIGIASSALAETITVTRGPNGASHQVKVDRIPQDAQVQPDTPATSVPAVTTKGPNGAPQIVQSEARSVAAQPSGNLQVVKRGPNGAAHIAN